ncbi:SRPBCC domain-containing protein [Lacinutrix sp. Bg11-31]|uniref:SRPBCC family protein n=1 Tax=Lacinutrix sp. Bg11-31 TaxID=2057808 RepID=UPI000C30422D|nr:SRPBCC domain-containing protein [Lacinutrix sp. Bg11-31]AUC82171.1 SRPBCC domain-containing protein [Lacinutrix sp. Bg11-31]
MSHTIFHDVVIKTKKENVFNAFTQPEHLNNWWTLKSSGKPEINADYNLNFTDQYNWYFKVLEVRLNKSFYLKTTKADDDWNPTTFGFELKEHEDGTLVEFTHTNWQENNHHFRNTSYCWALLLKGLKTYLEKDVIVPFNERD